MKFITFILFVFLLNICNFNYSESLKKNDITNIKKTGEEYNEITKKRFSGHIDNYTWKFISNLPSTEDECHEQGSWTNGLDKSGGTVFIRVFLNTGDHPERPYGANNAISLSFEDKDYKQVTLGDGRNHIWVKGKASNYRCDSQTPNPTFTLKWNDLVKFKGDKVYQSPEIDNKCTKKGATGCVKKCPNCPIYGADASFFQNEIDYTWDIGSIGISIAREYLSKQTKHSPFGYGWTFNHDTYLSVTRSNAVTGGYGSTTIFVIKSGIKSIFFFPPNPSIGQIAQNVTGLNENLFKISTGYKLSTKSGDFIYLFNQQGQLTEIYNNTSKHTYSYVNNKLDQIDVYKKKNNINSDFTLNFEYDFVQNKISKITDSFARSLQYYYDAIGNLIEVVDFDKKSQKYKYEDINDSHKLTSVISKTTATVLEATYDSNGDINSFTEFGEFANVMHGTDGENKYFQDSYNLGFQFDNKTIRNSKNQEVKRLINDVVTQDIRYHENEKFKQITDASKLTVEYEYDLKQRITSKVEINVGNLAEIQVGKFDTGFTFFKKDHETWHFYEWDENQSCSCKYTESVSNTKFNTSINDEGKLRKHINCGFSFASLDPNVHTWCVYPETQLDITNTPEIIVSLDDTSTIDSIYLQGNGVSVETTSCNDLGENVVNVITSSQLSNKVYDDHSRIRDEFQSYYKIKKSPTEDCLIKDLKDHPDAQVTKYEYIELDKNTSNERSLLKRIIDPLGFEDHYNYYGENTSLMNGDQCYAQDIDAFYAKVCTSKSKNGIEHLFTYHNSGLVFTIDQLIGDQGQEKVAKELIAFTYFVNDVTKVKKITRLGGFSIEYTYDEKGNVATTMDQAGALTSYSYDIMDRLVFISLPQNESQKALEYSFKYDVNSNIVETTLVGTNETYSYLYNDFDQLIETIQPDSETLSTLSYELERLKTITSRKGETTTFNYDAFKRLTSISNPSLGLTKSFSYGADFKSVNESVNNDQLKSRTEFDDLGRLSKVYEQVENGNMSLVATYLYNKNNNLATIIDAQNKEITFEYECANILKSVSNDENSIASYLYTTSEGVLDCTSKSLDGRVFRVTDANGNKVSFSYNDSLNKTITTFNDGKTITSQFDATLLIETFINEAAKVWTKSYDLQGNLKQETTPLFNETQYSYTKDGKLKEILYPEGNKQEITYNDNAEITNIKSLDANLNVDHSFDYIYNEFGDLVSIRQGNETTDEITRVYDNFNRLTSLEFVFLARKIEYSYNSESQLESKSFLQNGVLEDFIEYTYTKKGLLKELKENAGNNVSSFLYNEVDQLVELSYPSGLKKILTYDSLGRLSTILYQDNTNPGQLKLTYTYYPNNQIKDELREAFAFDTTKKVYTYDDRNRLIKVENFLNGVANGDDSYVYSDVGNKTQMIEGGVTKDITFDDENKLKRITFSNGQSAIDYIYNSNGSLITKDLGNEIQTYSYNGRNKLTNIEKVKNFVSTNFTYSYYPNSDLRMSVTTSGDTKYFVYEGQNEKYTLDANKNTLSSYVNLPFGYDNRLFSKKPNQDDEDEIFFTDVLNSVRGTFRQSATTKLRIQDYYAYGSLKNTTLETNPLNFGFTGRVEDSETGQKYYRGRYLDNDSGAFTQVDPFQDGSNWHSYVFGDPVNYSDPSGYLGFNRESGFGAIFGGGSSLVIGAGVGAIGNSAAFATFAAANPVGLTILGVGLATYGVYETYDYFFNKRICLSQGDKDFQDGALLGGIATGLAGSAKNLVTNLFGKTKNAFGLLRGWLSGGNKSKVYFGQKRAGNRFSKKKGVPSEIAGRLIDDVVLDLKSGKLSSDIFEISVFRHEPTGKLVSINTRGLGALSKAGLKPTNIKFISNPKASLLNRLNETPIIGSSLPSSKLPITPSRKDLTILEIIEIPR